ncbi:hypothetical protein LOAG_10087 [Loa loa]|uniref:Protein roadkill n=1 Tax=Loa loa TaxID=7209 RepID=A0A1I7VEE8_LOALO|nr:hypothetical protein LOAG_10087 [Loa loa]EFO18408.2 hypothetical protein LOAG_10087 [Loa loa]
MREISSSDNYYPEHILPGKSASTSTTSSLEPRARSISTSSMPSVSLTPFLSSSRHRLLPQIPTHHIRRSSSPRVLPIPPPLSSRSATTASAFSLQHWNFEQRPSTTGRRLPQTPIPEDSARLLTNRKNASSRQCLTTVNDGSSGSGGGDEDDDNNDDNIVTGNTDDNEWPSPTIVQRKFSDLRKVSRNDNNSASTLFEHITCDTSLRSLQRLSLLKQQQQQQQHRHHHHYQQQQQQHLQQQGGNFDQQQYSLDHSSGTSTSTNAYSQSSSLSPSVEQV